ncbi:protein containing flagellin : Flagellar protein OS=Geobacillus sp. A8 GN=GA8_04200 PE=4 SV=1: Flagellin_N: Flagellin_C [Gemmata massiliana]|uniref:Flagellin n=1 Tax=Gemmata massiliana TaxID=1210884 RepID=A0A6P2D5Q8_9BACT|nr:flagellin [Gemmata massiliana]VTR96403.1 protein containing flagellin : Flagellar protein OS=Geobacillus sp. A8 GN=GA8_04200 PE=4 SV=1: Flagellin_N: Flagellin_C [Gemmata massiliana]
MALSVVNNNASLNAQQNLNRTSTALSKSLERLSTGLKINRGADGPAGLVISEQQRAQIAGLTTAIDNSNKAVSLVQTAEGALNELNTLLTKARGLALDSANSGVQDSAALAANQAEITNALSTINNIANTTKFGSNKLLLNGQAGVLATTITNPSTLGQIKAGATAPTGNQTIAVGAAGGGTITGSGNVAAANLDGSVYTGAGNAAADAAFGAGAGLTISGGGLSASVFVDLSAQTTVAGAVTAIQNQLGSGFTVTATATSAPLVITAKDSNQALTITAATAQTSTNLGITAGTTTGTAGAATLTVKGGGLATAGVVVDLSGLTGASTNATVVNTVQAQLDAAAGTGNFSVALSGGKLQVTSKLSTAAVTLQSGNAATAAITGVANAAAEVGSAGATVSSTSVTNGTATGGRGTGANNITSAALTSSGTLTISGGSLTNSTSIVVSLATGDSSATIVSKVQAALDNASANGGGSGKFTVSGSVGGKLTIQSNVLGSSAINIQSDSAATAAVTGVSNGSADVGVAGNALRVFVGATEATVSTGSQGLGNAVTLGDATTGLTFNVGVASGKATSGSNTVNVTDNSLSFQIGANAGEFSKISIDKVTADRLGTGVSGLNNVATTDLSLINVTTSNGAQDAIKIIDQAITDVSTIRAKLGAFQTNSLESNTNSLRNTLENTTAAQSVIRDTDFASEIANFTRLQTQQQAGATVLGNANQTTALVAQLLRG